VKRNLFLALQFTHVDVAMRPCIVILLQRNCEMVLLGHDGAGRLDLTGRYELEHTEEGKSSSPHVVGYKFHKRLRVLPQKSIHKVKIRMSFGD
jgi:hypothetical protein